MFANAVPCSLAIVILAACPSITLAFKYNIIDRICIPDAVIQKQVPVPVGCKLVDCCPGCPGPGPLEWRVRIDAKALQGAELRFEGMGAAELKKLKVTGNARIDGDRILLRRGNSKIQGIPDKIGGNVAVGSLLPVAGMDAGARVRSLTSGTPAPGGSPGRASITDHITVQQYLGPFPVNDFRWRLIITRCPAPGRKPQVPWDTLKVQGHTPDESVAVMIDARAAAAVCSEGSDGNEWVFSATPGSTGSIILPNLRPAAGCNSEVVIFSQNHKMYFERNVSTWTNATGDVHPAPLEPLIDVPVAVWVADSVAEARAVGEINHANVLYKQNKVGVRFVASYKPLSNEIDNLIGTDRCEAVATIQESDFYTPKTLNVYYVTKDFYGRNCAIKHTPSACPATGDKGDGNITFIGSLVNLVAVAHELGHAFGLRPGPCGGHTGGGGVYLPGFDEHNIMLGDAAGLEDHFTLGQVFRMNTHKDEWGGTMLIENGLRPEADRRACVPDSDPDKLCPLLKTDLP